MPVVACTTMLGILERAGRAEECVPLLAHMRAGGLEAWDEAAFTTALNCLGRAGMLEEAQELLADMKVISTAVQCFWQSSTVTHSMVMLEEAQELLADMKVLIAPS